MSIMFVVPFAFLWRRAGQVPLMCLALFAFSSFPLHSQSNEFRALWVDAWNNDFNTSSKVTTLINNARAANLNALVVQVRRRGDAFYNSNFEPKSVSVSPQSFDPLQDLINKAHDTSGGKQRVEIHAWIVTYHIHAGATNATTPPQPDHPIRLHPEWLMPDVNGEVFLGNQYTFDPAHPEVQNHTFNVCMDIISNYDVDGLNFDYIRYGGTSEGYHPVSIERFNTLYNRSGIPTTGDASWKQFRRDQVTALVRKVYLNAMAIKPHVKISADTITWAPGPSNLSQWYSSSAAWNNVLQDWRGWMEEGILDLNIPMAYFRDSTHPADYTKWINFAKDHQYDRHAVIGPGNYLNSMTASIKQMRETREPSPSGNYAKGVCGYVYKQTNNEGLPFSTFINAVTQPSAYDPVTPPIFAQRADVPPMPWKVNPTKGHVKGFVFREGATNLLDGASITIAGPVNRAAVSDGTGFYGFVDLPPGSYSLTATFPGHGTETNGFIITAGVVTTLDLQVPFEDNVPPVISGVGTRNLSYQGVTIEWSTDEPANSVVEYGLNTAYGASVSNAALVVNHSVMLLGLAPDTTYHFRVRSTDALTNEAVLGDFTFTTPPEGVVDDIIVDNVEAETAGAWTVSTFSEGYHGVNYQYAGSGDGSRHVTFRPNIQVAGEYEVYEWHVRGGNRTTNAQHIIQHAGGTSVVYVDQEATAGGSRWNLLGSFDFDAGMNGYVRITDVFPDTTEVVMADGIRFVFVAPAAVPPTIVTHPTDQVVQQGGDAEFSVAAEGTAPLAFQWRRNTVPLDGATNSTLALTGVLTSNAGDYSCVITNSAGWVTSSNALLTVTLPAAPNLDAIELTGDGTVQLLLTGDPGATYVVEYTADWTNWLVLTNVVTLDGTVEIVDQMIATEGQRFYRGRVGP